MRTGEGLDAVTRSVLASALSGIAQEMGSVLIRSAYSSNIKERRDCSSALFDARGRMVAQAAHIPVHLGALPESVAAVMGRGPEPGDVFIVNDPYSGGSHLPDITMVAPMAPWGEIIGYAVTRAHHSDVGGMRPGSMPSTSGEIFQEGLVIPPVRLVRDGRYVTDVLDVILANVRTPFVRQGDLRAQIAANRLGEVRFRELIERKGRDLVMTGCDDLLAYTERRTREALERLPDGEYHASSEMEGDGVTEDDIPICVRVVIDGDSAIVDFSGTSPAVAGNVNCPISVTRSACNFAMQVLLAKDVPVSNGGTFAPIGIMAPEGCLVNARWPSAVVAGNVETSQRIADTVLMALSQVADVPAPGQGTMNVLVLGGPNWTYVETLGGGQGAHSRGAGASGVHVGMTNTLNTPIEALELEYPLRVDRYELAYGTGGGGLHRGGDGLVRSIRMLEPARLSLLTDRRRHAPRGLAGGGPGATGENRLDGTVLPAKVSRDLMAGDVVTVQTPGGGGFGSAEEDEVDGSERLPDDYLCVPDRVNITGAIVTRHVAEGRGDRPALHLENRTVTYAELETLTNRFGHALAAAGVGRGDHFVVRSPNSVEYVVAVLGGMKVGAVPIPASSLYRAWELEHILTNSGATLVFTTEELLGAFDEVAPHCPKLDEIVLLEGNRPGLRTFEEFLAGHPDTSALADTAADDPAYAIYTSGTTGRPKGVVHAHRIIVAAGDPVRYPYMQLTPDDRCFIPTELSFMMTLDFTIFFPMAAGAQGVLYRGRFDPERLLQTVQDHRVSVLVGVPTMFRMLLAVPDLEARYDLSSVRVGLCGGEPLPENTYREVMRRFGFEIREMMGQTEAHVYVVNLPTMPVKPGSLGVPIPGREVRVLDEDGKETAAGEVGHLCLRSDDPALALGYQHAEEQWRALHRDGWYYSGDLVSRDNDGYLWHVGRADDVILTRAYRVSPGEVEAATMEHPAVLEAAAVGVPDDMIGQRVKAFVVLKAGFDPSPALAEEITEAARARIAAYKIPKEIEFVPGLPKTPNGKIQRRVLREQAAEQGGSTERRST